MIFVTFVLYLNMQYEKEVYVQLYKIRLDMLAQIKAIEVAMANALPSDDILLDKISNLVSLGYYDYPRKGCISQKINFTLKMLGCANISEIAKYLKMLDENDINESELNKFFAKNTDQKHLIKYNDGETVKYKLTKS